MQLLNPCLHFTNNKLTFPTNIEETLEQIIILDPHNNLNFSSNNPYFFSIQTKNIPAETGDFTLYARSIHKYDFQRQSFTNTVTQC